VSSDITLRARRLAALAGLVVATGFTGGCHTTTLTAQNGVNPVFFGPPKRLGGQPYQARGPKTPFEMHADSEHTGSSSTSTSGNTQTTTTQTSDSATVRNNVEWQLHGDAHGDPEVAFSVDHARASGYAFLFVAPGGGAVMLKQSLQAKGAQLERSSRPAFGQLTPAPRHPPPPPSPPSPP